MPLTSELHVRALDSVFRLGSNDEELLDELHRLWRDCVLTACDVEEELQLGIGLAAGAWTVHQGRQVVGVAFDTTAAALLLATHLNAVAVRRCGGLAVHAGAIASDGAVVALAADSGVGKTTLTAACLSRGWAYVTDEALHLTPGGVVLPYPKPLTLSTTSRELLAVRSSRDGEEALVAVTDLGGQVAHSPLHLAHVVLLTRREHVAGGPQLTELHRAEVLTALLALSFNAYQRPGDSVDLLADVAARCRAWSLRCSDAQDAARLLTERLAGRQVTQGFGGG